jgi:hypothetical protein
MVQAGNFYQKSVMAKTNAVTRIVFGFLCRELLRFHTGVHKHRSLSV